MDLLHGAAVAHVLTQAPIRSGDPGRQVGRMLEAADLGKMISDEQGLPGELIGDPERKTTERACASR